MKLAKKLVSIIVPVFQVEEYLERCIESIVDQTYDEIEILLVVKQSIDGSYDICKKWEKKDKRITVFNQIGRGLGDARNTGIEYANGEYLCFVDSDDFLDKHYIEELLKTQKEEDADLVECDFWEYHSEKERIKRSNSTLNEVLGEEAKIIFGAPAAWKILSKRSFWTNNNLQFPNTIAEDLSIYMLMHVLANKTVSINKALYFYRVRADSLTGNMLASDSGYLKLLDVYSLSIRECQKRGLYYKYGNILLNQIVVGCKHYSSLYQKLYGGETGNRIIAQTKEFIRKEFGKTIFEKGIYILGSYNLGRIGNYLCIDNSIENRYSFSSLISVMSEHRESLEYSHNNPYRNKMLNRDTNKTFLSDIVHDEVKVVLIDFLEERFNIVEINKCYYTKSDAWDEALDETYFDRIIANDSKENMDLFKNACNRFIESLKEYDGLEIVLVEIYLCEKKGDFEHKIDFANIDYIRKTNRLLKERYDYFKEKYPEISVVCMEREDLCYADKEFEYGCYPWHMNEYAYMKLGLSLQYIISV